jgi:hypothetical protein
VEGILSVTVGGWSATDRFGSDIVRQHIVTKKRRVSVGSVAYGQRKRGGGLSLEKSIQENCGVNLRPDQAVGSSASTKQKGMRNTAQDRKERHSRRMLQGGGKMDSDGDLLKPGDFPCDGVVQEVLNVEAVEAQKRLGEL